MWTRLLLSLQGGDGGVRLPLLNDVGQSATPFCFFPPPLFYPIMLSFPLSFSFEPCWSVSAWQKRKRESEDERQVSWVRFPKGSPSWLCNCTSRAPQKQRCSIPALVSVATATGAPFCPYVMFFHLFTSTTMSCHPVQGE